MAIVWYSKYLNLCIFFVWLVESDSLILWLVEQFCGLLTFCIRVTIKHNHLLDEIRYQQIESNVCVSVR